MKKTAPMPGKDLALVVSKEIDDLLVSAPSLTPAGFLNQAIDELTVIAPGDSELEESPPTTKRFRLTLERFAKVARMAADTDLTESDVAIAAIRQLARKQPS